MKEKAENTLPPPLRSLHRREHLCVNHRKGRLLKPYKDERTDHTHTPPHTLMRTRTHARTHIDTPTRKCNTPSKAQPGNNHGASVFINVVFDSGYGETPIALTVAAVPSVVHDV